MTSLFVVLLLQAVAFARFQIITIKSKTGKTGITNRWRQTQCGSGRSNWEYEDRKWTTCSPKYDEDQKDCLLETEYYPLASVNKVFIEIGTATRNCSNFGKTYPQCNHNIQLGSYHGVQGRYPVYTKVSNVPAKISADISVFIRRSTFELNKMHKYSGVQLAFRAMKSCTTIVDLLLYYYKCPKLTDNLALFHELSAPDSFDKVVRTNGTCVNNAVLSNVTSDLALLCYHNGTFKVTGECWCNAGFYKNATRCKACPTGTFKSAAGNAKCHKCGANTIEGETRVNCPCIANFFRLEGEGRYPEADCYEAKTIRRLVYSNYTDGSVRLHWYSPVRRSKYQPTYIVSFNNKRLRMKNRELRFGSTNETKTIEVKVVTELNIRGRIYRSSPLVENITVHKRESSEMMNTSNNLVVILSFAATLVMLSSY